MNDLRFRRVERRRCCHPGGDQDACCIPARALVRRLRAGAPPACRRLRARLRIATPTRRAPAGAPQGRACPCPGRRPQHLPAPATTRHSGCRQSAGGTGGSGAPGDLVRLPAPSPIAPDHTGPSLTSPPCVLSPCLSCRQAQDNPQLVGLRLPGARYARRGAAAGGLDERQPQHGRQHDRQVQPDADCLYVPCQSTPALGAETPSRAPRAMAVWKRCARP